MNWKNVAMALGAILLLAVTWAFINDERKLVLQGRAIAKLQDENKKLKIAYLGLLEKVLRLENKLTPDVMKELSLLKEKAQILDQLVHIELESVIKLVNEGHGEKAVMDLAKIIENVLKLKAEKEGVFKKKPTLNNLLEHAGVSNWLNPEEIAVANHLRNLRNEESHQLAVRKPSHEIGFAIFGGIKLIYTLYMDMKINER
jgi:hypothetical protein